MSGHPLCEAQFAHEARRIFRKLLQPGAHVTASEDGEGFALFVSARARKRSFAVASAVMRECLRRDWLKASGATPERWHLSAAGEGWYLREQAQHTPFAAQHQLRGDKLVETHEGTRRVVINEGESPIGWLRKRKLVDQAQFDAAERLRRDYTLAHLSPRLGVDLSAPMVLGRRGASQGETFTETVVMAKQRFRAAMAAVGPGLADLLFDVCCHLTGLAAIEEGRQWPRRSAKVVLDIALDRLAAHYGMRVTGRARLPMRAWQAEMDAGG